MTFWGDFSMKVLLHTCCGPCGIGFLDGWRCDGYEMPDLLWHNPNIHPYMEYKHRKNAVMDFAKQYGLDVVMDDHYGLNDFVGATFDQQAQQAQQAQRCKICYEMRMNITAARAAKLNYTHFSTTLLASPWQKFDMICEAGEAAAKSHGVVFVVKDYRDGYRAAKQKATRQMGLYMQKYCGCIFSEYERYNS